MSARMERVLVALVVVVVVVAVVGLAAGAVVNARAASRRTGIAHAHSTQTGAVRCVRAVAGAGLTPARPATGSAGPQVVSSFAIFRRTRSAADALPAGVKVGEALAGAGAVSYDPSHAVRLRRIGKRGGVYAVPATMSLARVTAACAGLPPSTGAGGYLAFEGERTGSGPGACLISTRFGRAVTSALPLPGAPSSQPRLSVAEVNCESDAVLSGYVGPLGDVIGAGTGFALIPDGISAISYAHGDQRNGGGFIVPVAGNLAVPPAPSTQPASLHPTVAAVRRFYTTQLPTVVTESGPGGVPVATLTRPVSLIPDAVDNFRFERGLLESNSRVLTGTVSTSDYGASCSARTHRCVAVVVATTCRSQTHCRISRTIHRYRYVGARPPRGTTGPNTQATAPIVARVNRVFNRPRKLALVLSGPAHHHVVVLLSVNCASRGSALSSGEPPLTLAVPSRTPIAIPGPRNAVESCEVGALVTSTHHGPVHVRVERAAGR